MQPNLKRIVAYSSVAHLGFVVLGTFALTQQSIQGGAVHDDLARAHHRRAVPPRRHALRAPAHLRDRRRTRACGRRSRSSAACSSSPPFASIGLPGFSGFVGEFLSLLGAFLTSRWYVVVATTGVILAAVYLLWAVQRTVTGEPDGDNVGDAGRHAARDLHGRAVARPLAVPRLLPEAGARPGRAERRTARRTTSRTAATTRSLRVERRRPRRSQSRRSDE